MNADCKCFFKRWKTILVLTICLLAILVLAACNKSDKNSGDVLTQKQTQEGRTQITVLVKYAFTINAFETAVEEKFPDIDIVQVGNYTRDIGVAEYASRLEHDDLTDVVMTWPLEVGEEYWADRLLDLSGMEFTSRYNLSMLNTISREGKLYYLPGPSQVRGIVYNKTLFEEKGWGIPENYEEFLELCTTIEKSGMRSIQLGFSNGEVLDTAMIGYNYGSYFSRPQDNQWLTDFNGGTGDFGAQFTGALENFQQMIDAGIWKKSDLDINYSDREKMLFSRQCAMVEDSVLLARMGYDQAGNTDEFALMPFFDADGGDDWARLYMVCYIGLNKHLKDPENKDKYQLVLKLMDYISSPEGQEALSADTGAMFSSLSGTKPPDIPEIQDLIPALERGRYAVFPQLKNAQDALRKGLLGMISGDLTKDDVIEMVNAENVNPPQAALPQVLGMATEDFTLTETGNFVTDVMREWSGCDIALFLDNGKDGLFNGKGISARLYAGDVTDMDLKRILPDLKSGDTENLYKLTMTGENLLKSLEYTIPIENNKSGWFYYFSGLKMIYDPAAEPGSRTKNVTLSDGTKIDPKKIYSVAVMSDSVLEEWTQSRENTQVTITEILTEKIKKSESISPSKDGRFKFQ